MGPAEPDTGTSNLVLPPGPPRAFAVYAHRPPPATRPPATRPLAAGSSARSRLPAALAARGLAVLTLEIDADIPREEAAAAVLEAADRLRAAHRAPALLVGHSAAGPPVLAAATVLAEVAAVVTIGSPAPRSSRFRGTPLLVMHAPDDPVVAVQEASRVFAVARHPRSFIALDGVDHGVTDPRGADRVAGLIEAWADPYLPAPGPVAPADPTDEVVVAETGTGRYTQRITAGRHVLTADEPRSIGGDDAGPNPYALLLAALGACTSMTLRMYAERKDLPLGRTTVRLRHDRVHAEDCEAAAQQTGRLSRIRREITVTGPLTDDDRRRLVEIADRCPVHRTLSSEIVFETGGA